MVIVIFWAVNALNVIEMTTTGAKVSPFFSGHKVEYSEDQSMTTLQMSNSIHREGVCLYGILQ